MNEDQKQPVADAAKTQTNGSLEQTQTPDKSEQQNVANSESMANQEQNQNTADKSVKGNATAETPQEKPADTSPTDKTTETASDSKSAVTDTKSNAQAKADSPTTNPVDAIQPAQPKDDATKSTNPPAKDDQSSKPAEQPKKLSDVVPSTIVWLSGMVGKKQFDCAGPFSVPFVLEKPTWPYVTVAPNPKYTNQVFDYDADGGAGKWVPTDAKSQGQLLTDLAKQVTALKDDSQKHDQSADQSQKMGMQLTKVMLQLSSKVDALNTKIDGIVKDGDK